MVMDRSEADETGFARTTDRSQGAMQAVLFLTVILLLVTLPAAFLLIRRQQRRYAREELSAITRQHLDLLQGGQLNESAVESTKARFRDLLERGEVEAVEASLRA